jgi:acyl-[acyl-carrier-protein]-phospholipid O-acyltransferase/long-chain-fatty-acid--[acyl-carrier-protein] ligase
MIKLIFRPLLRLLLRFRSYNTAALSTPGPVLLLPNHVSWFDWLLLYVCLDDDWRFVTSEPASRVSPVHRFLMVNRHTFPVDPASPYAVKRMAEFLQGGGRLVLFPEGRLSLTGALMKLFDGTGFLLHKTKAKVITAYLRDAHRLPYSRHPGWKKCCPRVTAHFSELLTPPRLEHAGTAHARAALTAWLRDRMVEQQFNVEMEFGPRDVLSAVAATAAQIPGHVVMEDASGTELTYRKLMVGVRVLADALASRMGGPSSTSAPSSGAGAGGTAPSQDQRVGVLLPNVNGMPVTLLSLWALGKVPAILNFSTGPTVMVACCQLAGLKQVITSRLFLERARLKPEPFTQAGIELVFLEDVRATISGFDKFTALLASFFNPQSAIRNPQSPDSTAVVLFTSGSEGVPKGVELSHRNILANVRQMLAVTDLHDEDRLFNCLPLFHSFGLVVGTLLPLVRGMHVFLYPSPLHYKVVPSAVYESNCTVFLSTNTFLNGYARKANAYDFRSLRYLFAAAEKVQEATATTWSQKFGIRILEGYGATECAPCVCVNTPLEPRWGSVGKLLPGMEMKLEPVEGVEQGGRLFVRGPNVMRGYVNADADAKFKSHGGWYDTGDIVAVDAEGYMSIRGRMKRFAKVSGEMVSLTAVEDALAGAFPHYGLRCAVAVLAVPDEDKGERLIAVSNESKLQLGEVRDAVKARGLSNLCVPREIKVVREIPKLGTGKVNHRELQQMMEP